MTASEAKQQPDLTPDHYVLLCARAFADRLAKLRIAASEDERQRLTQWLEQAYDGAIAEAETERRRRECRVPEDLRDRLKTFKVAPLLRQISLEEAELVRHASAVPSPVMLKQISAKEMFALADQYEGWACDNRLDAVQIARLLGWADGARILAQAIGVSFEPPPRPIDEVKPPLFKFVADLMNAPKE